MESEFETSLEAEYNVVPNLPNKRQSSVFNLVISQNSIKIPPSKDVSEYEIQLSSEINKWNDLMKNTKNILRNSKGTNSTNGTLDMLHQDGKEYLNNAPNYNDYISASIRFSQKVEEYLQLQLPELVEAQTQLIDLSKTTKARSASLAAQKLFYDNSKINTE